MCPIATCRLLQSLTTMALPVAAQVAITAVGQPKRTRQIAVLFRQGVAAMQPWIAVGIDQHHAGLLAQQLQQPFRFQHLRIFVFQRRRAAIQASPIAILVEQPVRPPGRHRLQHQRSHA